MKSRSNPVGLMETTLSLPECWEPALINNDFSSFTDCPEDANDVEVIRLTKVLFGVCVSCAEGPEFWANHDATAHGVLACMCLTYTFIGE